MSQIKTKKTSFYTRNNNILQHAQMKFKSYDDIDNFIIDKIKEALIEHNGNQTKASNRLGIKRTTLIAKCKKLNIFTV